MIEESFEDYMVLTNQFTTCLKCGSLVNPHHRIEHEKFHENLQNELSSKRDIGDSHSPY